MTVLLGSKEVAVLEETQIVAAGRMLASAFQEDPLQEHIFPDPEERAQRSPAQFSVLIREGLLRGVVFVTEGLAGASVWMPPESSATPKAPVQSEFRQLPRLMGHRAFERFGRVLDYLSSAHGAGMPAEHWYLMIVGVRPEQQRHGFGEALIKPMLARADAACLPVCLDTAQPLVRPFYEKLGFKPVIETVDPDSGLRFWTYQRDPAQLASI
jgi:ribosomal protein S18 acetylase RimI-like enzyme